ncbi:hypothetical protein UNPF46_32850 [Bradyrhizobium sp. UNPF46]|nr:hypothetical protein UNPF46_32850 [Bradyrhizobium sp. UNPF46]
MPCALAQSPRAPDPGISARRRRTSLPIFSGSTERPPQLPRLGHPPRPSRPSSRPWTGQRPIPAKEPLYSEQVKKPSTMRCEHRTKVERVTFGRPSTTSRGLPKSFARPAIYRTRRKRRRTSRRSEPSMQRRQIMLHRPSESRKPPAASCPGSNAPP